MEKRCREEIGDERRDVEGLKWKGDEKRRKR